MKNLANEVRERLDDKFLGENGIHAALLFFDRGTPEIEMILRIPVKPTTNQQLESLLNRLSTGMLKTLQKVFKRVLKKDFVVPAGLTFNNEQISRDYAVLLQLVELIGRDKLEKMAEEAYSKLQQDKVIEDLKRIGDNDERL